LWCECDPVHALVQTLTDGWVRVPSCAVVVV
jgi:hypothetical protein